MHAVHSRCDTTFGIISRLANLDDFCTSFTPPDHFYDFDVVTEETFEEPSERMIRSIPELCVGAITIQSFCGHVYYYQAHPRCSDEPKWTKCPHGESPLFTFLLAALIDDPNDMRHFYTCLLEFLSRLGPEGDLHLSDMDELPVSACISFTWVGLVFVADAVGLLSYVCLLVDFQASFLLRVHAEGRPHMANRFLAYPHHQGSSTTGIYTIQSLGGQPSVLHRYPPFHPHGVAGQWATPPSWCLSVTAISDSPLPDGDRPHGAWQYHV